MSPILTRPTKFMNTVVHSGDAGTGRIRCGAQEHKVNVFLPNGKMLSRNWSWQTQEVTCKKCIHLLLSR